MLNNGLKFSLLFYNWKLAIGGLKLVESQRKSGFIGAEEYASIYFYEIREVYGMITTFFLICSHV
jgi:hypothetical protein